MYDGIFANNSSRGSQVSGREGAGRERRLEIRVRKRVHTHTHCSSEEQELMRKGDGGAEEEIYALTYYARKSDSCEI